LPDTPSIVLFRERGASLVEYGLILGVVGAVALSFVQSLGEEISDAFNASAESVAIGSFLFSTDPVEPEPFIFEVSTGTGAIFPSAGGTIYIDWGDETANASCTTVYTVVPSTPLTCNYPSPGTYQISITGKLTGYGQLFSSAYKSDIIRVVQWGNTGLKDLSYAFYGASNLVDVPGSLPSSVTDMSGAFQYASNLNDPDISMWSTGNVKSFSKTFSRALSFDVDVGSWDTSAATNLNEMFYGASSFNRDLNNWDVSSVANMDRLFAETSFNGNVASWDMSSVQTLRSIFRDNPSFNGDISGWDVANVQDFTRAFMSASDFNADISNWQTGSASSMNSMFYGATNFSQDLSEWDVSQVSSFVGMVILP